MKPVVTKCYQTELASLGKFRCPVWHPTFSMKGQASGCLIVFPREAVSITQTGRKPVVANPTVAMFYNKDQEYSRDRISQRGDRCDFFRFPTNIVVESIQRFDPSVEDRREVPFANTHGPISHDLFLEQRRLFERVQNQEFEHDSDAWNEAALQVLDQCVEQLFKWRGIVRTKLGVAPKVLANRRRLVFDAQELISKDFDQRIRIEELAAQLSASPYHLCRVFREETGITIHKYLTSIRLRVAVDRLRDGAEDLTRLALDIGFSSHSHFTSTFRQAFRKTPSQWRAKYTS